MTRHGRGRHGGGVGEGETPTLGKEWVRLWFLLEDGKEGERRQLGIKVGIKRSGLARIHLLDRRIEGWEHGLALTIP